MIIKYRIFKNSESFEEFQIGNDIKLHGITPMVGSMDMEALSSNKNSTFSAEVQVFVTYSEE